jgi:hypothetical protein
MQVEQAKEAYTIEDFILHTLTSGVRLRSREAQIANHRIPQPIEFDRSQWPDFVDIDICPAGAERAEADDAEDRSPLDRRPDLRSR